MCCVHKTHKVRLLILLGKNFLQAKAMPEVRLTQSHFVGFVADMVIFRIEKQKIRKIT